MSEHILTLKKIDVTNDDGSVTQYLKVWVDGKMLAGWELEDGDQINWDHVAGMDLNDIVVDLTEVFFGRFGNFDVSKLV